MVVVVVVVLVVISVVVVVVVNTLLLMAASSTQENFGPKYRCSCTIKKSFSFKILLKSNGFERRGRSEQMARSGRDKKSIIFN